MSAATAIEAQAHRPASKRHAEQYVDVEGTRVRYLEGGLGNPGPVVVLLHGFQNGAEIWHPHTFRALAHSHHVMALDLPGFGYSGPLRKYSIESFSHFLHAFFDTLNLPEVDL